MGRNLHTLIRDLQRRKARERRGLVVAEGLKLVEEVLAAGARVEAVLAADYADEGPAAELLARARGEGLAVEVMPAKDFEALAQTETPSGVLAVVAWEPLALAGLERRDGCLLVLDAVQDPGNVGTMIRTAHAFGAVATVALDGTADVRNSKVVRSAMGAMFRHQVVEARFEDFLPFAERAGYQLWLAGAHGGHLDVGPRPDRLALVIGSEGHGLRTQWAPHVSRRVTIPMRPGAESLNAAVAAGILLFELTRAAR